MIKRQFTQLYPNVEVRLYHNNGEITVFTGSGPTTGKVQVKTKHAGRHHQTCRSLLLKRRGVDMLFPNTSLEELTSDKVYEFAECKSVYLALLQYYSDLFDYPREQDRWNRGDADYRNGCIWWVMNEGWEYFGTLNPILPMAWLSISKRALYWEHIPVNFYPVALAILESFDLERYQKAYQLPQEEYEAMKRDLPVVLEGLRNYPADKLAPPMDEDNWGYNDQ